MVKHTDRLSQICAFQNKTSDLVQPTNIRPSRTDPRHVKVNTAILYFCRIIMSCINFSLVQKFGFVVFKSVGKFLFKNCDSELSFQCIVLLPLYCINTCNGIEGCRPY